MHFCIPDGASRALEKVGHHPLAPDRTDATNISGDDDASSGDDGEAAASGETTPSAGAGYCDEMVYYFVASVLGFQAVGVVLAVWVGLCIVSKDVREGSLSCVMEIFKAIMEGDE